MPKLSAFPAPETANRERPAASRTNQKRGGNLAGELIRKEDRRTAGKGNCTIPPIPNCVRRNGSDQQIADDAATERGGKGENHEPQKIQVARDCAHGAFKGEKKRPGQVYGEQQSFCVVPENGS